MKNFFLVTFLIIALNFNLAYAKNFEYPDANLYKYDDYEVNFTVLYKDEIKQNVKYSGSLINDNKIIDYVINFNYDLNAYNNKFFSAYIINELAMNVEKNVLSLSKNIKAINFISSHEFSDDFSDNGVKNKLLAWVLMRQSLNEEDYEYFTQRRIDLLNSIIKNNKKYAPMTHYLISCIEYLWLDLKPESLKKGIEGLELVIKQYPNSEFAAYAHISIVYEYAFNFKNYDAAIQYAQKATEYKNFYRGFKSDFYTELFIPLLKVYSEKNDTQMVKLILSKMNKNSSNYKKIFEHYSKF